MQAIDYLNLHAANKKLGINGILAAIPLAIPFGWQPSLPDLDFNSIKDIQTGLFSTEPDL